jgi:hypothetical protein
MHRAEPSNVVAAELFRSALERFTRAKANELLKRRIEISFSPDQKIEPFHDQRLEFELKLTRTCLDAETYVNSASGDGHGKIHLGPLDSVDAVEIAFPQAFPFEQLGQHQFAAGLRLTRLKTQAARGGERVD